MNNSSKNQGLMAGIVAILVVCIAAGLYFSGIFENGKENQTSETKVPFTTVENETTEVIETTKTIETTTEAETTTKVESKEEKNIRKGLEKEGKGVVEGKTYMNPLFGLKFKAPSGYQLQETTGNIDMRAVSPEGNNLNVIVVKNQSNMPISSMMDDAKKQLETQLSGQGLKVEMGEADTDKLAGEEYITLGYDLEMNGVKMHGTQFYREQRGYIIIITITDLDNSFEEMKKGFSKL